MRAPADDPETIAQATARAFAAGAHGIVISREYEEMKVEHLARGRARGARSVALGRVNANPPA